MGLRIDKLDIELNEDHFILMSEWLDTKTALWDWYFTQKEKDSVQYLMDNALFDDSDEFVTIHISFKERDILNEIREQWIEYLKHK